MLRHRNAAIALGLVSLFRGPLPTPPCWGDVNNDSTVDVADAQLIGRYAIGMRIADSATMIARGDVTADRRVNVSDAQQIARHSVGLPSARRLSDGCTP